MNRIRLSTGLLLRAGSLLLVRTHYRNEREPLWTLPGGRQERGEGLLETVARETWEESGLRVRASDLAYVSESIDPVRGLQITNFTFWLQESDPAAPLHARDNAVAEVAFMPQDEALALLRADVLRIPVTAALNSQPRRYFEFRPEDIVVPFFSGAGAQT